MGDKHAPSDQRNIAEGLNLNKKPNRDSHVSRYRGITMDTNVRAQVASVRAQVAFTTKLSHDSRVSLLAKRLKL